MEKRYLYFAYGSNLNLAQMCKRCPESAALSPAVLEGYKLCERIYADIEESAGDCVNGALYEVSEKDLAALDRYEGYPECYVRKEVMVTDNAGVFRKALVYIMTDEYIKLREHGKYSARYRQICSAGADDWGIPNGFALQDKAPETLWNNNIPEIPAGLNKILSYLESGEVIPRAKRLWIGARVALTLKKQDIQGNMNFYPAPLEVVTPHALELSWLFYDLRDIFTQGKFLDSCNKFDFYHVLAETALGSIAHDPDIGAKELCRKTAEKAREVYQQSKEVK